MVLSDELKMKKKYTSNKYVSLVMCKENNICRWVIRTLRKPMMEIFCKNG